MSKEKKAGEGLGQREKLKPVGEYLVIKQDSGENMSPGGIVLPELSREKPMRGEILAVSVSCDHVDLKPGRVVVFNRYAGTEVEVDGERLLLLKQVDVMAVIV